MTTLRIVIVNWRTAALAIDTLASLEAQIRPGMHVVVTDNASGDDSADRLDAAVAEHGWQRWCEIRRLPKNGGFAYGNNEGIRDALASDSPPKYVLLLNPDTIVRDGAIDALLAFMESHPQVGITGSRLENHDGSPQISAFRFHSISSELDWALRLGVVSKLLRNRALAPPVADVPHETGWVCGASMMIRREVFDAIGLLDDGYFMYYEEVDFCLRAKRAGWPTWFVPESRVVHLVGQASGVTDKAKQNRRRPAYWFESRQRYFHRNHGWLYTAVADAAFIAGFAAYRVRRRLQNKPDTDPQQLLGDFTRASTIGKLFKRKAAL